MPKRPPGLWLKHCAKKVGRRVKNATAVCAATWHHTMKPAARAFAALKHEGSPAAVRRKHKRCKRCGRFKNRKCLNCLRGRS